MLALGFGADPAEAGHRALASLLDDSDALRAEYVRGWQDWQETLTAAEAGRRPGGRDLYRISTAVLQTARRPEHPGRDHRQPLDPLGRVAGRRGEGAGHRRAITWSGPATSWSRRRAARGRGEARGASACSTTCGRPRRPTATGPRTCGSAAPSTGPASSSARPPSRSCCSTCSAATGRSPPGDLARYWPMVRAGRRLHRPERPVDPAGPLGEPAGLHPVHPRGRDRRPAGRRRAGRRRRASRRSAPYLRETADAWNAAIESWLYVTGTELARRVGVEGYYVRSIPPEQDEAATPRLGHVELEETPDRQGGHPGHRGRQPRRPGPGPVRAPRRRTTRGSSTR